MSKKRLKKEKLKTWDLTLEEILFDKIEREQIEGPHKKYHKQLTKYLIWLHEEEVIIDDKMLIHIDVEKRIGRGCTDVYLAWLDFSKYKETPERNIRRYKNLLYSGKDEGPTKELHPLITEMIEVTSDPKCFASKDKYELYAGYVDLFSVAAPKSCYEDLKIKFGTINQYTPNRIWIWDNYKFSILIPLGNPNRIFKKKKLPQTRKIMEGMDLL